MLTSIINQSLQKLKVFDITEGEVLAYLMNQFYFKMMDEFAVHLSADSEAKETIIFLHNCQQT
jgi:hypothetical protein